MVEKEPEEEFQEQILRALRAIKREFVYTPKGEPVELCNRHKRARGILKKIEDLRAINIIKEYEGCYYLEIIQPKFDELCLLYESGIDYQEAGTKKSPTTLKKTSIIKPKTLEFIAKEIADLDSGSNLIEFLINCGVERKLVEYPSTKWRMIYSVLMIFATSSKKEDKETLFKIIEESCHPLMHNGSELIAKKFAEEFNRRLKYDKLILGFAEDEGKFYLTRLLSKEEEKELEGDFLFQDRIEVEQEAEEREKRELAFLQKTENREKISTLRKTYQLLINIVDVFCESPSNPTHELNDAYVKTKKLVTDVVNDLYLYVDVVDGEQNLHKLRHYCIPFNNLFTAEEEYKDIRHEKLGWDEIRPKMHATFGCIDELYREVEGSDILSTPNVQQTLNDISLLLSKTKGKIKEKSPQKDDKKEPQTTRIEITSMPELKVSGLQTLSSTKNTKISSSELYLNTVGDLWREPKNKYCYAMGEKSDRHKIVRYLANNKGYQQTSAISSELEGKSEQSIRTEIGKIRGNIKEFLKIDGKQVIEEGRKGSGYRMGSKYKIKIIS